MRKIWLVLSVGALVACGDAGTGGNTEPLGEATPTQDGHGDPLRECSLREAQSSPPERTAVASLLKSTTAGQVVVLFNGVPYCVSSPSGAATFIQGIKSLSFSSLAPHNSDPMPATGDDPSPASGGEGNSDPMPARGK